MLELFKNSYFQYTSLFIFLIASIVFVSNPGWNGYFIFDDFPNILNNNTFQTIEFNFSKIWTATQSSLGDSIGRPVSMFSFAINSLIHGLNPFYFKLTNTIVHCINAILLFVFTSKLLSFPQFKDKLDLPHNNAINHTIVISFIIALTWAISPININSSLYIVQRMNELSFLFVLMGCIFYLNIRTKKEFTHFKQILFFILFCLLFILASLSKQNGVLLIPLVFLLEFIFIKPRKLQINNTFFYSTCILLLIIPIILGSIYFFTHIDKFIYFVHRDFSLYERLLSQPRILVFYNKQLLFPDISLLTYFHDDFIKSVSLLSPISTITSILFWSFSLIGSIYYYKKFPWLLFGLLWFFIGHSIESSFLPLELVFEHRNYLPSFGIIFICVLSAYYIYSKTKNYQLKKLLLVALLFYIILLLFYAYSSAKIIGNPLLLFKTYAENHPNSARSQIIWGDIHYRLYVQNPTKKSYADSAKKIFTKVININSKRLAAYTNIILLKQIDQEAITQDLTQLYLLLAELKNKDQHTEDIKQFILKNSQLSEPIPREIIEQIFTIVLSNLNFKGKNKAILHKVYADYLSQFPDTSVTVIKHYALLVKYYPTVKVKLMFVVKLMDLKQYKQAKIVLSELEIVNKQNLYSVGINNLKKMINKKLNPIK